MRAKKKTKAIIGATPIEKATKVILDAMRKADGDVERAAQALGTTKDYLLEAMHRYGIKRDKRTGAAVSTYKDNTGPVRFSNDELHDALEATGGDVYQAADRLGVFPYRVYARMHALGMKLPSELPLASREEVMDALQATGGVRNAAAEMLGISVASLYRLCQSYGVQAIDQSSGISIEEVMAALHEAEGSRLLAAAYLGISPTTVSRMLERHGMPSIREIKSSAEAPSATKEELLAALAAAENDLGDTAAMLGVARTTIPRLLERYGLPSIRELKRAAKERLS